MHYRQHHDAKGRRKHNPNRARCFSLNSSPKMVQLDHHAPRKASDPPHNMARFVIPNRMQAVAFNAGGTPARRYALA
jgi:hypothetical protein